MVLKVCSLCKNEKEYSEFHKDKHQKDGLKNQCKECRKTKKLKKNHKNLDKCISRSIYRAFKNNKKGYIWERIINISFDELKQHLENQFDSDMTWENYGNYWVIDKIIPTSMYRYSDKINNEFQKAWSLKNLRPYQRKLHNSKKSKVLWEVVDNYKIFDILPIGLLGDIL
jgi:hypothetical protein